MIDLFYIHGLTLGLPSMTHEPFAHSVDPRSDCTEFGLILDQHYLIMRYFPFKNTLKKQKLGFY